MGTRDKLIDILNKHTAVKDEDAADYNEWLADVLIENGVEVLPCRIGDSVWWIDDTDGYRIREEEDAIQAIAITRSGVYISTESDSVQRDGFDKVNTNYAYLSMEEAEKGLAEKQSNARTIKWHLDTGFAGCSYEGEFEVDKDTPEYKIEEQAREEAFNNISWSWREDNGEI